MPKKFDDAVKAGGRVITVTPKLGMRLHVVYPKGGGPPIAGEVKRVKKRKK